MNKYNLVYVLLIVSSCNMNSSDRDIIEAHNDNQHLSDSSLYLPRDENFPILVRSSRIENQNVFLLFSFKGCGICRIFENYHNDPVVKTILSKYIIIKEIDVNLTHGGSELYSIYGKSGFPSWSIIDSAKRVIAHSGNLKSGEGNIGFPFNQNSRYHYLNALKKAAPSISSSECDILYEKLKEYRPEKSEPEPVREGMRSEE